MAESDRKHFFVKHGLDALKALPHAIWRADKGRDDLPHWFSQVKKGDRWVAFAYTTSDRHERPLSLVTGFYECTKEKEYVPIPEAALDAADGRKWAWLIEGTPEGEQPKHPVGVPPINDMLQKSTWNNQAMVPITAADYDRIRRYMLSRQFDPGRVPLFGRQPENEQELLAAVVCGHKDLGIEKILRVRKAFPDLLVQFAGSSEEVHLELEVYSEGFISYGHYEQVENGRFTGDGKPIAVLCWIDNKKDVKKHVERVFELQSLIREEKKIEWK